MDKDKWLNEISTHWTEIEMFKEKGEIRELTDYMAARYYEPLVAVFRKYSSRFDNLKAHEFASEIFYDFIKNDYRALQNLSQKILLSTTIEDSTLRELNQKNLPKNLLNALNEILKLEKKYSLLKAPLSVEVVQLNSKWKITKQDYFIKYVSIKNEKKLLIYKIGTIRGLFYYIIKAKLSKLPETQQSLANFEKEDQSLEGYIDTLLDLEENLEKLKQKRPKLYKPFFYYTFEGKSYAELSKLLNLKEDAIRQRLKSARVELSKYLDIAQK